MNFIYPPVSTKQVFRILIILISLLCAGTLSAQQVLKDKLTSYTEQNLQEKIYLHLDRSLYIIGETIWLKAYLVEGGSHHLLDLSKVTYVELLDKNNNVVQQAKIAMLDGTGSGYLNIPTALESGNYQVRAYTSWMKNFSPDFYFNSSVTIANTFEPLSGGSAGEVLSDIDIQFFPEGGDLVADLESKIGFRAINEAGKGVDFDGFLVDQKGDTVARFKPDNFGIGSFNFKPGLGVVYKAVVKRANEADFETSFPLVKESGYVMKVSNHSKELLKIEVAASKDHSSGLVYLLLHTRLTKAVAMQKQFEEGKAVFLVDKKKLGEGISHFTIFDSESRPVCERLFFKQPEKELKIKASTKDGHFRIREKVELAIETESAVPQSADLSVSVHWLDSLTKQESTSISEFLWLTSDLKGVVENPGFYLDKTVDRSVQIDNLMLTHGWSRFRWEDVLDAKPVQHLYVPEYGGHFVTGKVTQKLTGKPDARVATYLSAPSVKPMLYVGVSDYLGNVRFEMKHFRGTKEIVVQTNAITDSTSVVEIANPFSDQFLQARSSNFAYDSTLSQSFLRRSINMQLSNSFTPKSYLVPEYQEKDSLGFYGTPNERYLLDDYTRFPTVEEVMREYVTGVSVRQRKGKFYFRVADKLRISTFFNDDPLLLLDGIPVFDMDKIMAYDPLKIKKLEVVTGIYFLGPLRFTGLISYSTYKGDMGGFELNPKALVMQYDGVQVLRQFYSPRYDLAAKANSRIPDFRNLLHWEPKVVTDKAGKQTLTFYTSDLEGTFRVVIQGMTKDGQAGKTTMEFVVGNEKARQ